MICPKCVSHNPEQAESCHWCGNVLRQEQEASSAETVVACVACGNQLNPTANFCSRCGVARIPLNEPVETEPQLACAHCGGSLNLGDNYCKWCGIAAVEAAVRSSTIPENPTLPMKGAVAFGSKIPVLDSLKHRITQKKLAKEEERSRRKAIPPELIRAALSERPELIRIMLSKRSEPSEYERAIKEAESALIRENIAAQKEERRAQKEAERAERKAAQKEAARQERERAPVKSGNSDSSDLEPFLMIIEIFVIPAVIQYIKTHPNGKLDVKQIAVKNGIPSAVVPFLTKMLTDYLKQRGMKPPW